MKIKSCLIANRGEVACRLIKTTAALGIRSIAIYAEDDRHALFVKQADEAYCLGQGPLSETYLNVEKILAIAKACDVDAVHPGYGFLSENPDFARRLTNVGIKFIGPTPEAIERMALKAAAKTFVESIGIQTIPGYIDQDDNPTAVLKAAEKMGFPVLLKASAGGGGKGMRCLESADDFISQYQQAKREALKSFSDASLILEKYFGESRHIESQIIADTNGNVVHLAERDCSAQRRHQKVIEEAPARLSDIARQRVREFSLKIAREMGYVSAGTIEYLVYHDDVYFLEMNTRLQVEHPVTEMISGIDIVQWQFLIAAGQALPLTQDQISFKGASIEVRLYAESPEQGFLPAAGRVESLQIPTGTHWRIDHGVQIGDTVGIAYDPMLMKCIVHAANRDAAILSMSQLLDQLVLTGVQTNQAFLQTFITLPEFSSANYHTQSIKQLESSWMQALACPDKDRLVIALTALMSLRASMPFSHWRMNAPLLETVIFSLDDQLHRCQVEHAADGIIYHHADGPIRLLSNITKEQMTLTIGSQHYRVSILHIAESHYHLTCRGRYFDLKIQASLHTGENLELSEADLTAPMPGRILKWFVNNGDCVKTGDKLLILEAMKMEHTVTAPLSGRIDKRLYEAGAQVDKGALLLAIEDHDGH